MRHRLVALAVLAPAVFASTLVSTAPAHASTLQEVYSDLPYSICIAFGTSGQQNDRWGTWWCSASYPTSPYYPTFDLWAYVN